MINLRKFRLKPLPTAWLRDELSFRAEQSEQGAAFMLELCYRISQSAFYVRLLRQLRKERARYIQIKRALDRF